MSRNPATLYLADGTELFGLWNGTVEQMWPRVFPTVEERDEAWENLPKAEWYETYECACVPEKCILFNDTDVLVGSACRVHLIYRGPYSAEDLPNFGVTARYWNYKGERGR